MRVLIVDDEPIARARLARLIGRLEGVEVAGEAGDGREALERVAALAPDVLLLDIDMPGMDGLAVADSPEVPPVIFTTAHREHALTAFEAGAYDYLLKPVSLERLERALAKVARRAPPAGEPWRLVVTEGSIKRFVDAREVDLFRAEQKYVAFEHRGREGLLRESLDALEARLEALGFLRIHRGALVRLGAIEAFDNADGGSVVLAGGERIPVSRRAAPRVRAALGV